MGGYVSMGTKSTEIPGVCENTQCRGAIDVRTLCCVLCGVSHSEPCTSCGRFGFHRDDCAEMQPAPVASGTRLRVVCAWCTVVQDPGSPGADTTHICCRTCCEKCVPDLPYPEVG